MKKYERWVWISIVAAMIAAMIIINNSRENLQHLFVAGPDQKEIVNRSVTSMMKDQGMTRGDIDRLFVISYAYFSKETCIRFVPKPGVTGGATSYCYGNTGNAPLLRIDKVA